MHDDENEDFFTDRPSVGHNNPPKTEVEKAADKLAIANTLLTEVPVIKTQEQADLFGRTIAELRVTFKAVDNERFDKVDPLNKQVEKINAEYRPHKKVINDTADKLLFINRNWLLEQDRLKAERDKQIREEAERKQAEAEKARQRASAEAERAKDGDVTDGPIDVVGATLAASKATLDAHIATATANKAERTKVSSGGGGGLRAVTLHDVEVPSLKNKTEMLKVVKLIGMDYGLAESVLTAAKAFHKATKIWPPGITVTVERR